LERLSRATGDLNKAQKLQAIAIDVAAGSGKSLETVTNALAKAAEGQTASLGKLGVG
jgi:cytidylate kinase